MVYAVSYDLIKNKNYSALIEEIKRTNWAHILESTWAVETSESVEQLFTRLSATTDSDDRVFIVRLERNFTWWSKNLPKDVLEWIRAVRERA